MNNLLTATQLDLLDIVGSGNIATLVLLNLSAVFDAIDHEILPDRLLVTVVVDKSVLAWFESYL